MKRLMFVSVLALILLGSWSQSVSGLDRPYIVPENGDNNGSGDHPWGGDNNTPDVTPPANKTTLVTLPQTGIGTIDLVLRVFSYKFMSTTGRVKAGHTTTITTTTTTSTTTTVKVKTNDNQ